MSSLEIDSADQMETDEPIAIRCDDESLRVTLADHRKIVTPLWWYPRLLAGSQDERNHYELSPFGIHWPDLDEDLSIEGMLRGAKAPGAVDPNEA